MIPNLIVIHSPFHRTSKLNLFATFLDIPKVLATPEDISPVLNLASCMSLKFSVTLELSLPYLFIIFIYSSLIKPESIKFVSFFLTPRTIRSKRNPHKYYGDTVLLKLQKYFDIT